MAEVQLLYVNGDSDFTEVDPLVDTTTFGGATIGNAGDPNAIVISPTGGSQFGGPEIDFTADDGEITGLATPDGTDLTAAVNVDFVNGKVDGLDVKNSVLAASTANINLTPGSSPDAVDGITVDVLGDRILVKNQTDPTENGIYEVVTAGGGTDDNTWARATDANTIELLNANAFTFVEESTSGQEDTGWVVTNSPTGLDGASPATDIDWTQFSNKGVNTASGGVQLIGVDFSLDLIATADGTGGLEIVSNEVGIDFSTTFAEDGKPIQASDLASIANGEGASIIGIEDVGTYYTAGDVEGALQEIGADLASIAPSAFTLTAGAAIAVGDLVYMTANDTIEPMPITALHRPVGVAATAGGAAALITVIDHGLLTSVVTGGGFGSQQFWTGSAWSSVATSTSGEYVWKVGVAANATSGVVFPQFVKKNT